jgi:hypothetical protein
MHCTPGNCKVLRTPVSNEEPPPTATDEADRETALPDDLAGLIDLPPPAADDDDDENAGPVTA